MKGGMSLEQLKQELETDATKRNAAQEKTIKELLSENAQLKSDITALQNRCVVYSHGMLCLFCGMKATCKRGRE